MGVISLYPVDEETLGFHSLFLSLSLSTHEGNWVPVNYQKNSTECWGASCEGSAPYARRISVITVA